MKKLTCEKCGKKFVKWNKGFRFCSDECRLLSRQKKCKQCEISFVAHGRNPGIFCSRKCKGNWQNGNQEWKDFVREHSPVKIPVTKEWLINAYWTERKSTNEIAEIVNRSASTVVGWFHKLGIKLRDPWDYPNSMQGVKRPKEFKEMMRQLRLKDGHVPYLQNGKHWLKGRRGADTPNWKGGITPERQAFYSSNEWKRAQYRVKRRDNLTCQRCGKCKRQHKRDSFDIHHIVSFECVELRAVPENLVYLCEECHYWCHSSENVRKLFIKEIPKCYQK